MYRNDNPGKHNAITASEALEAARLVIANLPYGAAFDSEIAGAANTVTRFLKSLMREPQSQDVSEH